MRDHCDTFIASAMPGHQPAATELGLGVMRQVISSAVRLTPGSFASAAAPVGE